MAGEMKVSVHIIEEMMNEKALETALASICQRKSTPRMAHIPSSDIDTIPSSCPDLNPVRTTEAAVQLLPDA